MKGDEKVKSSFPEVVDGIPAGEIVRAIAGLQYGSVTIIVQDSKVVQIDRTEKKRVTYRAERDYEI